MNPVTFAAVVASLMVSGCGVAANADAGGDQTTVKCEGVNECKGQGECGGTNADGGLHGCEGLNDCRGQGWIELPASECDARGGSPVR
jgi:hypothetical protein